MVIHLQGFFLSKTLTKRATIRDSEVTISRRIKYEQGENRAFVRAV